MSFKHFSRYNTYLGSNQTTTIPCSPSTSFIVFHGGFINLVKRIRTIILGRRSTAAAAYVSSDRIRRLPLIIRVSCHIIQLNTPCPWPLAI
ncbi:hypothetical protein HanXRQr2_Chr05g0237711 [Helianthus annuus]|uniref:Uncharacterized protein n=1 Tax=Helianthus annuus TaxID=4232 RepID=A0A9K3NQJ6_HELAN|nr:hypothetical protein HanXRQr2_Chr05g0237711 [Helianthus annuus]KAJ0924542.1 hypothetical protein HanPSC8_Chr05g0229301 [Helianthus annuus]